MKIENIFISNLLPDPVFTVSEWADTYRQIPSTAGAEVGPWRTSRAPYLKKIMDVLSPGHPTRKVIFVKPSQIGGTETAQNSIMSYAHLAPGPILYVHSTLDTAEKWSKQRFQPSVDITPVMREIFKPARSRDSGNTLMVKNFKGGLLMITGSNSASALRSMPVRYLLMDEVSSYPGDVDQEGDPVKLAEARTSNYSFNRKIFLFSTPGLKGFCRITAEYEMSNKQQYHVPCPFCGHMQTLKWAGLVWDKDENGKHLHRKGIWYQCESCGQRIAEHHKTEMLARGEWIAEAPEIEIEGFWINALYAPIGWVSWFDIVDEHLKARGDEELRKAWTNNRLAETFEVSSEGFESSELYKLRERYTAPVPRGVAVLTAGVDVQKDRLEITTAGWGRHYTGYVIEHTAIPGDPALDATWALLDQYLERQWTGPDGEPFQIVAGCVDSRYMTDHVYKYIKPRQGRRVVAVMGSPEPGKPVFRRPSRPNAQGVLVYSLGTDTIKDAIFSKAKIGQLHFPDTLDELYFEQLASERVQTKMHFGFPQRVYVKDPGARNEALDCLVYSYAACVILNPSWDALLKDTEPAPAAVPEVELANHPLVPQRRMPPRRRTGKRGGGWI